MCVCVFVYVHTKHARTHNTRTHKHIEGPIGVCQLLETTLLCIVNYASLVATNAARMRMAVGLEKTLLEFGLRRSQV